MMPLTPNPAPDTGPVLPFATAQLRRRRHTAVVFAPDAAMRAVLAATLDLLALPAFRMTGAFVPEGPHDLRLEARITARVVQACSVTLAPVETRIDEPVLRRYLTDYQEPDTADVEVPEDDSAEPMPDSIDAAAVALEALALALPMYPRAAGAGLGEAVFAPPGAVPLRNDDLRPFAGLASLVARADPDPDDAPDGDPEPGAAG